MNIVEFFELKVSALHCNTLIHCTSSTFLFFSHRYKMYNYNKILPLMLSITRKNVFQRTFDTGREKKNDKHSDPFLLLTGTVIYI